MGYPVSFHNPNTYSTGIVNSKWPTCVSVFDLAVLGVEIWPGHD